jgi:hypothetical protein
MALLSPGVQVSVIDQSNYTPAAAGSVPFILLATAQNKVSGAGTGIAPGTLAANANKLYIMTSQRDLLSTFGVPFFYNTTAGTPINGYELNEYGLLAAYSALGVTNTAYVMRADIDLAALTASLTRPTGAPANGTYWLDTTNSTWGVTQWNQTTSTFVSETPIIITNDNQLVANTTVPSPNVGSIGNYAVVSTNVNNPIYYKRGGPTTAEAPNWIEASGNASSLYNTWVQVGGDEWKTAWPTVQGNNTPQTLTANNVITINSQNVTIGTSPNNTVQAFVANVNTALNNYGVFAANMGGKFTLYANSAATGDVVTVTNAVGNANTNITTLSFATQDTTPYAVGDSIVVANVNPSGYNGTYTVTACTANAVSYTSTETASYVSGGTIRNAAGGTIYIEDYLGNSLATLGMVAGEYQAPQYDYGPNYSAPRWRSTDTMPAPTGSVFQQTNVVNAGMLIEIKKYNSTLGTFVLQSCPVYSNDANALYQLDPTGGGTNIAVGSTYGKIDPYNNSTAGLVIYERLATGPTIVTGANANPTFTTASTFTIQYTEAGTPNVTSAVTATISGTTPADFVAAVSAAVGYGSPVSALVNSSGQLVFEHSEGGDIYLVNGTNNPLTTAGFTTSVTGVRTTYVAGVANGLTLSNWVGYPTFTYTASADAPDVNPTNGTYWYYSTATEADIMIQNDGAWMGYQMVDNDVRGYNLTATSPDGPIFAATAPAEVGGQSDGTNLVNGDLWIDTSPSGLEHYPVISRWQTVNGQDQWVQINNTDHTTINGILFADARWSINGDANPITDPLPPIATGSTPLIRSEWTDPDVPDPLLYPQGTLLWNTRRSGFNVKSFAVNYFNTTDYPPPATLPANVNTWVTASANNADGTPNMGRHAQRYLIVQALRASIDTNTQIRENQAAFNLVACPQYPELAPNMVLLNNDRGDVGFNVVDTPLRLSPDDIVAWANNTGIYTDFGATSSLTSLYSEGNLASGDSYSGAFYPSCLTTDLTGNTVMTAPSHMMLRTIIRSDAVAYPWFAPAGLRRGVVDNALQIGYLNSATGNFTPLGVNQGQRDVLYQNDINPITFIPGTGIVNFGNHTLQGTNSALDRINVARLVAYLRGRLEIIGNQYLFEPNDTITRSSIQTQITSLMVDLVGKRAIYDYLVVCDLTNNTPATIDANELYVDIAIEPVKAVEFIYIPMRIQNTGTIQAQAVA